jgi:hypothetical protein
MISNIYTGGARDNPYIALALVIVIFCIYLQAYFNLQQFAANIGVMALWLVVCNAMTASGVSGVGWAWLTPVAPIATLISGRISGLVWASISLATLWAFAVIQDKSFHFPNAVETADSYTYFIAMEGSLILLMPSVATQVFRGTQTRAEQGMLPYRVLKSK